MPFSFSNVTVAGGPNGTRLSVRNLVLPPSGLTVLAGPSGAGKSTLLRLCNRLDVPSTGSVALKTRPLDEIPVIELRRRVGMVFQTPVTFPGSVLDNLREADPHISPSAASRLLDRTGLDPDLLDRTADNLSGGEAQRMCIARALATDPEVLLMDEPTASLDPAATKTIEAQCSQLAATGMPIIWVTHDIHQLKRIAAQVVCLIAGQVALQGEPSKLLESSDPAVQSYLAEEVHVE